MTISVAETPIVQQGQSLAMETGIELLFASSPQFTIERGLNGIFQPQVFFPWKSDLHVAELTDVKAIRHRSLAPATLHSHLPVNLSPLSTRDRLVPAVTEQGNKRPAFDIGVFETPNMMSFEGYEIGTVGFNYFLEDPIGDSLRTEETTKRANIGSQFSDLSRLSTTEAMKLMHVDGQHHGLNSSWWDRQALSRNHKLWKEIGVRNITMATIDVRISFLTSWYNAMAKGGWRTTILDLMDEGSLYDELFTLLLYPTSMAPKSTSRSLEVQIEALVRVLSVPGAWIDFSLVSSRLNLGRILWQRDPSDSGADRQWLLIQGLLSVELAMRLDALLRIATTAESDNVKRLGIQHYRTLKTQKVDWDIVMARNFIDNAYVESHINAFPAVNVSENRDTIKSLLASWKRKKESHNLRKELSPWDSVVIPRQLNRQVEGLISFAESIAWPNMLDFEYKLLERAHRFATADTFARQKSFFEPLQGGGSTTTAKSVQNPELKNNRSTLLVDLQPASETTSGGWLSRTWFSGIILPGESISHILIATLLEQDPGNLAAIGVHADLRGGFQLNGRSWWSKYCIVGKVMAAFDGAAEDMGWISIPYVVILDRRGRRTSNGWFTIGCRQLPAHNRPHRIHERKLVTKESRPIPLEHPEDKSTKQFQVVEDPADAPGKKISIDNLTLRESSKGSMLSGFISFSISRDTQDQPVHIEWELSWDVHFVSTYHCQLSGPQLSSQDGHQQEHRLHGHPLHSSYSFTIMPISELLNWHNPGTSNIESKKRHVYIIDARGGTSQELLARAWCSNVGQHALISRARKTCLSCSIREANALDITIVIRLGPYLSPRQ